MQALFSAYSLFFISPLAFFSTSFRGTIIWCPHPMHFRRKSAPTRRTSHSWLPQGWGFFILITSPTANLSAIILLLSSGTRQCITCVSHSDTICLLINLRQHAVHKKSFVFCNTGTSRKADNLGICIHLYAEIIQR